MQATQFLALVGAAVHLVSRLVISVWLQETAVLIATLYLHI